MHVEVADEIEELVARRFVGTKRRTAREDRVPADDDDALRRDMASEPAREELLDLMLEAERPRRRDPLPEVGGISVPASVRNEPRVAVVDLDLDAHSVVRSELEAALADLDHPFPRDDESVGVRRRPRPASASMKVRAPPSASGIPGPSMTRTTPS